ncbi:MAG: DUF4349 domain-containing protein [Treponema sp.]|nr:DUF4349 domain-containing protein [Treponema sp.]
MKKINKIKCGILILSALLLVSCGKDKVEVFEAPVSTQKTTAFAAPKMAVNKMAVAESTEEAFFDMDDRIAVNGAAASSGVNIKYERKIVRNGNVSLEVDDLEDSQERIGEWAARFGGYIVNSWESESSANYTVKIPSEKFDEAFNETKTYGKFLNGNVNSDDITDQYYDLETRLEAKKILRDRLTGYLKNAKETKELLNIERELNNTVSEIESMEGRLRRMKDQVAYSTINVNLQLPYRQTSEGFEWPSWSNGFRRFASNVLDFFIGLFQVILYVLVCGIPVVAIILLLYWLLFGKIGLIKKLFKKLK